MAVKFLTALDLTNNEILNVRLQNLAADPATGYEGLVYFNTTSHEPRIYRNGVWEDMGTPTINGTANEVKVTQNGSTFTLALHDDVTIPNDLTVTGNLTVSGTTTTVNAETISLADNIIVLNSNATGAPTENGGIEVERGDEANVGIRWNETTDKWQVTFDGTAWVDVLASSMVEGSNSLSATYANGTLTLDTTLKATDPYLTKASGLAVDVAALEDRFEQDGFTRTVNAKIGNGTLTSIEVAHDLGINSTWQVREVATNKVVYCDMKVEADKATFTFSAAPSTDQYLAIGVGAAQPSLV